jgi:protein ImuB
LAEALAIEKQLFIWDEDVAGDRRALERLAEWAQRYSPIVGLEEEAPPQSLLLDISGCAACFHGEDRLAQQAAREFRRQGWKIRIAVADTLGAAWGVAHYSDAEAFSIVPPGETETTLAPLPIAALRLPAEAVAALAALGIEWIAQLTSLPRSSVPGRFGASVLQRLDQALGRLPELIVSHQPPPKIQASCSFAYPTDRAHVLHHALDHLLERIEATLRSRNRGARKLECWLYHETLPPVRLEVDLFRPSGSARHLGKLLRSQLERVRTAEPITRLALRVPVVEMMVQRQLELFDVDSRTEELGDLIDRLVSQFGREAVTFARLIEDCQPEYACRFEPALGPEKTRRQGDKEKGRQKDVSFPVSPSPCLPVFPSDGRRPVLMWPVPMPIEVLAAFPAGTPLRFAWLGEEYTVSHCWGPERIETGWWRGQDVHRDYYTVATHAGTRLWLFRRHEDQRWFVHGCFD